MPIHFRNTSAIAISSIAVAALVMGIKYAAFLMTGSVALYSDALESVVNVVTAIIAVIAIKVSAQPPDRRHQFGHDKAEYFSAIVEGVLIVLAALMIFHEAYGALVQPRRLDQPLSGMAINGLATMLNAAWCYFLIRYGRARRSPALEADGWHILTDVITSVGVLLGLVLAVATGWSILDPLLAGIVALNILWTGWRLTSASFSSLMDEAVPVETAHRFTEIIAAHASGALQMHDLRTRHAGRATFIEFHLVVPGQMSVSAAHEICDRIEAALSETIDGAQVVIHIEPEGEAKVTGAIVF